MMLTMLKNGLFFTFELNKRLVQKFVEFVSNLDSYTFWDKNPNRSTQPDTLKNFLQLWKVFLFLVLNLNVCLV